MGIHRMRGLQRKTSSEQTIYSSCKNNYTRRFITVGATTTGTKSKHTQNVDADKVTPTDNLTNGPKNVSTEMHSETSGNQKFETVNATATYTAAVNDDSGPMVNDNAYIHDEGSNSVLNHWGRNFMRERKERGHSVGPRFGGGGDNVPLELEVTRSDGSEAASIASFRRPQDGMQQNAPGELANSSINIAQLSQEQVLEAAAVGRMAGVSITSHPLGDRSPKRLTGMWKVGDIIDTQDAVINFRHIDDIESSIMDEKRGFVQHQNEEAYVPQCAEQSDNKVAAPYTGTDALMEYEEEQKWKHKLMFTHKFRKTPKHLTWKELGQEIECMDCVIDMDEDRPEDIYSVSFFFRDRKQGGRTEVWTARNDVASSEGLSDMLAAVGSCLSRADVHRTIRFDDGKGCFRELNIRKNSRYTSDVVLGFRPPEYYDMYARAKHDNAWEKEADEQGIPTWGYHPSMQDPEYRDVVEAESTYHVTMSAHAFSFIILSALDRLLTRPLKEFYRPSKIVAHGLVKSTEDIGLSHALCGWLGVEEKVFPHFHPLEAIEAHWFGKDIPFTLAAIINKLRDSTYLKPKNPEFHSWLQQRTKDTLAASRNITAKLAGAGASPLFAPVTHSGTMNMMLPKEQRRIVKTKISVAGLLGMPDETKKLDQLRHLAAVGKLPEGTGTPAAQQTGAQK